MSRSKKAPLGNPFYAVLLLLGIVFFITATAYGVMAFRAVAPHPRLDDQQNHPLLRFLDIYGMQLLLGEVALLAAATFAAIGTDNYWTRRGERRRDRQGPDGTG